MLWERYAERSRKAILHAEDWAIRLRSPYISSEHILLGLLEEEDTLAVQILERLGVNIHQLKAELESQLRVQAPAHPPVGAPTLTSPAKQVLIRAADDTAHLLLGLLRERQGLAAKILAKYNVRFEDVRQRFFEMKEEGIGEQIHELPQPKASILSTVMEDWTQKAEGGAFSPVSFWQQERLLLYLTLLRREQRNALLLGNFETATLFVQQIACDLASQSVPEPMQGRRLLQIDWGNLFLQRHRIAGLLSVCLREVASLSPPPLVFIGTVDDLWYWSDAPLAAVQHGHIHCLATATNEQWFVFASRYPAVAATFSAVPISEPDEFQAKEWLQAHRKAYEAFHGVTIDHSAITAALHIAKEQFSDQPLLATAKKLLDMACAYCRAQKPLLTQEMTSLQRELDALREEAQQAAQAGEQQRSQELQQQAEELQKRLEALLEQLPSLPATVTEEAVHSVAGMVKL